MMTDPIADMLTRIRNASMVHKREVLIPFSKVKLAIANILVKAGYITKAEKVKDKHPYLVLTLKYENGNQIIHHLGRVSKPGKRFYVKKDSIPVVLNGLGMSIVSTPKGLMTDGEARKAKLGGEIICEVY